MYLIKDKELLSRRYENCKLIEIRIEDYKFEIFHCCPKRYKFIKYIIKVFINSIIYSI